MKKGPEEVGRGSRGNSAACVSCGGYFKKMYSDRFYSKNKSTSTQ